MAAVMKWTPVNFTSLLFGGPVISLIKPASEKWIACRSVCLERVPCTPAKHGADVPSARLGCGGFAGSMSMAPQPLEWTCCSSDSHSSDMQF